jgi:Domain of unknown function (DUF222)
VFEPAEAAIDALAAVDVDALGDDDLHQLTVGLCRLTARLAALRARVTGTWDARKVWAEDGSRTAAARLARECGLSPGSAAAELRRARGLRSMPATSAAMAEGSLSIDQVDLLQRANQPEVAERFARDETRLVAHCQRLRFSQARRAIDYWRQLADDEGETDRALRLRDGRWCSVARTFHDTVAVQAVLDPVAGSAFTDELERLERELFAADRAAAAEGALSRSGPQRRADALVLMALRSRMAPAGGLAPRPLITVLVDYPTLAGRVCELANGTVVSPADVAPLLSDADIERAVFDGPSRVIDVGARRRLFTGRLRRAIEVRDGRCQHPSGCDQPASRCEVDHIIPYSVGGHTTQENGRL